VNNGKYFLGKKQSKESNIKRSNKLKEDYLFLNILENYQVKIIITGMEVHHLEPYGLEFNNKFKRIIRKRINKYYKKYYSKNKDKFQEYVKNHENEIIVRRETRNRF